MNDKFSVLDKKDYQEPRCLLIDENESIPENITPIPQQRVIAKMNEYMDKRDYNGAQRHLLYWLNEAKAGNDKRGELMVRNELVGHYRKTGEKDPAFESADEALKLIDVLDYDGSISAATTYVNVATMYNAFNENERSVALFEKAKAIYETSPATRAELLGGLYNNMALVNVSLKRFDEANDLYNKALAVMDNVKNGQLEKAVTYLNMANAAENEYGLEKSESRIFDLLDLAAEMLDTPSLPRDGYYAFVCEKCCPTFEYYGYFADAKRFREISEKIYGDNSHDRS